MIVPGWNRRPRLCRLDPEDIATIWLLLSDQGREVVAQDAADLGLTIEAFIRQRATHVQVILRGCAKSASQVT